ncbi:bifunctional 4-hydroxy-2-oxoglutarate aldolase/2-dehydro-3-deoxy-phosphogluconate aldolase [Christiangramia sp. LLG6405-1]|uniref:bifunctional 4-hydroxy-2-oxoglutarate aldolase/2-dehydro-3-deoxy-phosphogluconate aldolase n=1 Tax=Christiangramia sp. LLG6405-1 TaxID=3160832 RepID=UPI00386C3CCC
MAKLSRLQVYEIMATTGMVPLFSHQDVKTSKEIIDACYKGGTRVLEFTAREYNAHTVFEEISTYIRENYSDMAIGIGSVTDAASASLFIQLGADFIVTPVFREDIAVVCNRRKIAFFPGCGSLSEIAKAEEAGCEIVKLFPGAIYGPEFIKAVKGPQPWTSIMPTGGVAPTKENLTKWFEAGCTCVGMGSKLFVKNASGEFDLDKIESVTRECLQTIKDFKNN